MTAEMSDYDDLSAPTSLSPFERQTLALQHQILSYLDEGEADYHRRIQEVLMQGFTAEYGNVFSPYSELPYDELPPAVRHPRHVPGDEGEHRGAGRG